MPRLSLKPDSSFFRKIVTGVVGAREVCNDLAHYGHEMVELERGSTDTKLWKDVKRKRVRIPDLVCIRCGSRVESRAKTKPELSMSHSPTDAERAWDFGMVASDIIAFPVSVPVNEENWSSGQLGSHSSYWRERNVIEWETTGFVNYFFVRDFRLVQAGGASTKGVTEGSETSVYWDAIFSTKTGIVESTENGRIRVNDGRPYTWQNKPGIPVVVEPGEKVFKNQVIASGVPPIKAEALKCKGELSPVHLTQLLTSVERTQRFTGVKLARLRREHGYCDDIKRLAENEEEDVYVRLEAISYLASVHDESAEHLFRPFLGNVDEQIQLEAVISLADTGNEDAVGILSKILKDDTKKYFLRSAAAWSLSQIKSSSAIGHLLSVFSEMDQDLRQDALDGIIHIGQAALPTLLVAIESNDQDVAAGSAEAIRQMNMQLKSSQPIASELVDKLATVSDPTWLVWLLGHLPKDAVADSIHELQDSRPELHYAISVLWAFVDSWISRRWELYPNPINSSK